MSEHLVRDPDGIVRPCHCAAPRSHGERLLHDLPEQRIRDLERELAEAKATNAFLEKEHADDARLRVQDAEYQESLREQLTRSEARCRDQLQLLISAREALYGMIHEVACAPEGDHDNGCPIAIRDNLIRRIDTALATDGGDK